MAFDEQKVKAIFRAHPQVALAYLFGSRVRGKAGPLSDYDFAVYIEERNAQKRFEIRLELLIDLSKRLQTENVDLVVLNDVESPELKYEVVREGRLLFEREPYKVLLVPRILSEYFDFMHGLRKYGLTKA